MPVEMEQIGACRLYRGDCYELLGELQADALVSDPPYGIGFDFTKDRTNRKSGLRWGNGKFGSVPCLWTSSVYGDDKPFDPIPWLQFSQVILWGANHYSSALPANPCWLIWDKRDGTTSDNHSDCEMAWTNLSGPARLYRHLWRGLCLAGAENAAHGSKMHPAQKPLALMRWCVEKTTGVVLDPFAGSFTTALACLELGRPCIAIEIDPHYWNIGCRRLEEAYKQARLFTPIPPPPRQEVLL